VSFTVASELWVYHRIAWLEVTYAEYQARCRCRKSTVTSDAGFLAFRELDDALALTGRIRASGDSNPS
jgi:hypothetical protein